MGNPFCYGRVVEGKAFFDRSRIKADIRNVLDGGNNVVLYGPRRYGKSSLVGEILGGLRSEGVLCAQINLMDVASLDDFICKYAKVIYREVSPVAGTLKHVMGLFKRMSPVLGMDAEGRPELKFEIASVRSGLPALREVLEIPARICPQGKRIVVAIDEFQEIGGLGLGVQFERTMRTVVESQRNVSYVFLGSKTHLMRRMFSLKSRPFYNSAQKFELHRPPVEESVAFLVKRFKDAGLTLPAEVAKGMVERAGNVPYYLQALGSWTFNVVSNRSARKVSEADVDEGFESLYASERILLENTFFGHPASQRVLLQALAQEPTERFDEGYRARHLLASTSTINPALKRLMDESTVEDVDGAYTLVDPLLAYHLKRQT